LGLVPVALDWGMAAVLRKTEAGCIYNLGRGVEREKAVVAARQTWGQLLASLRCPSA